jgi:hypothetical protein
MQKVAAIAIEFAQPNPQGLFSINLMTELLGSVNTQDDLVAQGEMERGFWWGRVAHG